MAVLTQWKQGIRASYFPPSQSSSLETPRDLHWAQLPFDSLKIQFETFE